MCLSLFDTPINLAFNPERAHTAPHIKHTPSRSSPAVCIQFKVKATEWGRTDPADDTHQIRQQSESCLMPSNTLLNILNKAKKKK